MRLARRDNVSVGRQWRGVVVTDSLTFSDNTLKFFFLINNRGAQQELA